MFKPFLLSSCLLTCTVSLTTTLVEQTGAVAQTPPTPTKLPTTGLRLTTQAIDQVCNFLQSQQIFTVDMDVNYDDVLESGEKVQYSAYQKVWVQKPNRLRSDYVGDERNTHLYYNGKTFTLQVPDLNYYATKAAPATIDAALEGFEKNYGVTIPMSNLVASDLCTTLKSQVQKSVFVGTNMVNRIPMYHILMTGIDRDLQVWLTQDAQPLLRKVVLTYKTLPGSPQYTAVFSNWNFSPNIADDTFTFTPPEGAIAIEFLPSQLNREATVKDSR